MSDEVARGFREAQAAQVRDDDRSRRLHSRSAQQVCGGAIPKEDAAPGVGVRMGVRSEVGAARWCCCGAAKGHMAPVVLEGGLRDSRRVELERYKPAAHTSLVTHALALCLDLIHRPLAAVTGRIVRRAARQAVAVAEHAAQCELLAQCAADITVATHLGVTRGDRTSRRRSRRVRPRSRSPRTTMARGSTALESARRAAWSAEPLVLSLTSADLSSSLAATLLASSPGVGSREGSYGDGLET